MFYTVYKTTNIINQKIYIGTHITDDPNDDYLGSGVPFTRSVKKYGPDNFTKEILFIFNNPEDMFDKEKDLVNEDFINRKDNYNIKLGGEGGWDYVNKNGLNIANLKGYASIGGEASVIKSRELRSNTEWVLAFSNSVSDGMKEYYKTNENGFKNKHHTLETIQHLKESHRGKHAGPLNSQFGTMWVKNHEGNKKIKKEELDKYLEMGYTKGRKIK